MDVVIIDANVPYEEFEQIEKLNNCKIVFFENPYNKNSKLPLRVSVNLIKSKIDVEYVKVKLEGKEVSNFRICRYAVKLKEDGHNVFILSPDKSFDDFRYFNILRIDSLTKINIEKNIRKILKDKFPEEAIIYNDGYINQIKLAILFLDESRIKFLLKTYLINIDDEIINDLCIKFEQYYLTPVCSLEENS